MVDGLTSVSLTPPAVTNSSPPPRPITCKGIDLSQEIARRISFFVISATRFSGFNLSCSQTICANDFGTQSAKTFNQLRFGFVEIKD